MFKKATALLFIGIITFGSNGLSLAMMYVEAEENHSAIAQATYEYEGNIYNFCCAMCIDEFKKDPQKYIKKIEEEKQKEK